MRENKVKPGTIGPVRSQAVSEFWACGCVRDWSGALILCGNGPERCSRLKPSHKGEAVDEAKPVDESCPCGDPACNECLTDRAANILQGIVETLEMLADSRDMEGCPGIQNALLTWSGDIGAAWLEHGGLQEPKRSASGN